MNRCKCRQLIVVVAKKNGYTFSDLEPGKFWQWFPSAINSNIKNKKVSKANKSRTLLRYSISYHYDLIYLSTSDANRKIAVYVANNTRLPYLDVRGTCIWTESTPDGWFYSRSASTFITTCAIGSVISHRPEWVLPCSSVTLSNIISFLIYPAAFISSMLYYVLSHK